MPAAPDEKGLICDQIRVAAAFDLLYILMEIIQNRNWNENKGTAKFIFSTFALSGQRYFVVGYNHYRTDTSMKMENTSFNWRKNSESNATMGTRGYGAKLFPLRIGGQYSNYYHLEDKDEFPGTNLEKWGMKQAINIKTLTELMGQNGDVSDRMHEFRESYINPCNSKDGASPTLLINSEFVRSPLFDFISAQNFKYFYIFRDYEPQIDIQIDSVLSKLARVFETNNVELYQSKKLDCPTLLTVPQGSGLGLTEKDWAGAFVLEWVLGEKDNSGLFWKSVFRYYNPISGHEFYGRISSNGSTDKSFAYRTISYKPEKPWVPELRITNAITSHRYDAAAKAHYANNPSIVAAMAHRVYISIENDLVDDEPSDFGMNSKIRHQPAPSRNRIRVDILQQKIKDNDVYGLSLGHVKKTTSLNEKGALIEMIKITMSRAADYFKSIIAVAVTQGIEKPDEALSKTDFYNDKAIIEKIQKCIESDKTGTERAQRRKREGIKFETRIAEILEEKFSRYCVDNLEFDIDWEVGDTLIYSNHELETQGIDILGRLELEARTIWIPIQVKDKEHGLNNEDKKKFPITVDELKEKYNGDTFIPMLILKKPKSYSADLAMDMLEKGVITVLESGPDTSIGNRTLNIIDKELDKVF